MHEKTWIGYPFIIRECYKETFSSNSDLSAAGDNLEEKSAFVWRKNIAKERATMQNERRSEWERLGWGKKKKTEKSVC